MIDDSSSPAIVVSADNLWYSHKKVQAVRGVSLQISEGEIYGLVGPDGAGKTTLLRILVGMLDPEKGTTSIFGKPATSESADVRSFVGYMPQQYSLYGDLSVDENLAFFGSMFGLAKHVYAERRTMLLGLTRLEKFGKRRADALSGGMYKKLALACALLHRPRVLVLDEPTNGVDPVSRREFWDLISAFVGEGMGVIISTPYMDEASRCTRVGLMHNGQILEQGIPREMLRSFDGFAYTVECEDRNRLAQSLEEHSSVIALSPAGGGLRIVLTKSGLEDVQRIVASFDGVLKPVHPVFEDVFFMKLHNSVVGAVNK